MSYLRIPTYVLNEDIEVGPKFDIKLPKGTSVKPVQDYNLADHLKDALDNARKTFNNPFGYDYVMCIVGIEWYPICRKKIKEIR